MWRTPRKCSPAMMITTPAILPSSDRLSTMSWPAAVAVAPRITKMVVKPSTNATEDMITVL